MKTLTFPELSEAGYSVSSAESSAAVSRQSPEMQIANRIMVQRVGEETARATWVDPRDKLSECWDGLQKICEAIHMDGQAGWSKRLYRLDECSRKRFAECRIVNFVS